MTSRDFAFWLQGFFEITEPTDISSVQTEMIKAHLKLVFVHEIDPSYTNDQKKQEEMNKIHNEKPSEILFGPAQFPNNGTMRC